MEETLEKLVDRPLKDMTDDERRAFVVHLRSLRTNTAAMRQHFKGGRKAIVEDDEEETAQTKQVKQKAFDEF